MIISEIFMINVNRVDDAIEFLDDNYCFYDLTFSEIFRDGIDFGLIIYLIKTGLVMM